MHRLQNFVLGLGLLSVRLARSGAISVDEKSFIVNGITADEGRYPYYTSVKYSDKYTPLKHDCGGSLIGDRLVLTAAHCAPFKQMNGTFLRAAQPEDFIQAGLNFTAFPNSYVLNGTGPVSIAVVGAQDRNGTGIATEDIAMWFVHPQYDVNSHQNDIAVALLSNPVMNVTKAKLLNTSEDVYGVVSTDAVLTVVGLGRYINKNVDTLLLGLNLTDMLINDDPNHVLDEVELGTLVPRLPCQRLLNGLAKPLTGPDFQNGNFNLSTPKMVLSTGQICVGPQSDAEAEKQGLALSYRLAEGVLPDNIREQLEEQGLNASDPSAIYQYLPIAKGVCGGDSGGPIFLKGAEAALDVQIGLASFAGCGSEIPSGFTSVPAYLDYSLYDDFLLNVMNAVPDMDSTDAEATQMTSTLPTLPTLPPAVASTG